MEAFDYTALPARVIFGFRTLARVADQSLLSAASAPSFCPIRIMLGRVRRD
jgi:hypothetical protein